MPKLSLPFKTDQPDGVQPSADEWQRDRRAFRRSVVLIVALLAVGAIAFNALRSSSSGSIAAFNRCIRDTRFLALVTHQSGHRLIETIKDRADGAVAGEFAALPSVQAREDFPTPMAGTGEANGRWILFTATLGGRDANSILSCGNPEFPVAPGY